MGVPPHNPSASSAAPPAPEPEKASGSKQKTNGGGSKNIMSPKELEMAAYATGREVEELMKMSKAEVKALILQVVANGKKKKRSRIRTKSRSRSRKSEDVA